MVQEKKLRKALRMKIWLIELILSGSVITTVYLPLASP